MAYRIFIDGGHGTTGLEIRERLLGRNDIELIDIPEGFRKDLSARAEMAKKADITIMCLPDYASGELAKVLPDDVRVIDTSTAHRVDPSWVYGMPELSSEKRQEISGAAKVANPGCHATGFILLARPLVDAGFIDPDAALTCFCITGYSGGGRRMIEDYDKRHIEERAVSPAQYALGQIHKHLPEMKMMSGLNKPPVFCPVVGDFYRGMVMTIELPKDILARSVSKEGIKEMLSERYEEEPLIKVVDGPANGLLESDAMKMSDCVEIMAEGNDDRIILMARYDNLGKGASGAAVQNMNIMLGADETKGLRL